MKRRKFVATASALALSGASQAMPKTNHAKAEDEQQLIEWRTYTLSSGGRKSTLDNYLKNALIPAMNRHGIENVGVFKDISRSEPLKIHLFVPHVSAKDFSEITDVLANDQAYQNASKEYHALDKNNPVFSRYESALLLGFKAMPKLVAPKEQKKIYELRTYESYSDDAAGRKIDMFDKYEVKLFEDLGFQAVFYGKMLAGKYMPCLTYMVCFDSMEDMEKYWDKFRTSEGWAAIKDLPEYANTVSKIHKNFLEPLSYSQI